VTAHGSGGITVGQYAQEPTGGVPFNFAGAPFDVAVSEVNTFTSVTIKDCALNGATTLWWYNPAGTDGAGGWQPVAPATYTPAGHTGFTPTPACLTITVSATSSPTLAELTGTAFDGAFPAQNASVSIGGATPYSISGPVLSGSVTITAGLLSLVQGTVVIAGTHGNPVTIGINEICLFGACLGTITVTDPAAGVQEAIPSSISLGSIQADEATAQGEVFPGRDASPYSFSWTVTVTPPGG
jgi:hypothetical protein